MRSGSFVHDAMDASRVQRVREEMERAEARRLQPHYIESFFREAFRQLGGLFTERSVRIGEYLRLRAFDAAAGRADHNSSSACEPKRTSSRVLASGFW